MFSHAPQQQSWLKRNVGTLCVLFCVYSKNHVFLDAPTTAIAQKKLRHLCVHSLASTPNMMMFFLTPQQQLSLKRKARTLLCVLLSLLHKINVFHQIQHAYENSFPSQSATLGELRLSSTGHPTPPCPTHGDRPQSSGPPHSVERLFASLGQFQLQEARG